MVSEIIKLITRTNNSDFFKEPLLSFGRDSLWLIKNAENLWKEYTEKNKRAEEINSIAINTIKDYKKANQAVLSLQDSKWTDDYPLIIVSVIKENDTLSVYSAGQHPYMLPWHINRKIVYNSKISELVSELLPDKDPGNKERLSGKEFNNSLVGKIRELFFEDKENYLEARNKFPKTFKLLEKEFEITKAQIADISSIEWEGDECLEMSIKDLKISKNIEFCTISGINEILSTKRSIINERKHLVNLLKENRIYKYTLNCDSCLGEIHWVKSKSLSTVAKNNFEEDLQENGVDKNKYEGKYKDAIFFELTENRNSKRSFSRWIFLKDGTLILWELRGSFLLNFPKDLSESQGYVCKEIKL